MREANIPFGSPVLAFAQQSIEFNKGSAITIKKTTRTVSTIVAIDIEASSGIIYVIHKVFIPAL